MTNNNLKVQPSCLRTNKSKQSKLKSDHSNSKTVYISGKKFYLVNTIRVQIFHNEACV